MKFNVHKEHPAIILLVTTIASFLTTFAASSVNIVLPVIGSEMKMSAVILGWVATSFLLTIAVFLIPLGKISDTAGRKKIFSYGILLYIVSSGLSAVSLFDWMLIFSRVLQGIGAAMVFATSSAIVTAAFSPGKRGRAIGINTAAVYIGSSAGPFFGGIITHYLGWRGVFAFTVLLGIIVLPLVLIFIPQDSPEKRTGKFDTPGTMLSAAGLSCLIVGISLLPAISGIISGVAGVIIIIIFIKWESGRANPILEIKLFRKNPSFLFSNLTAMINYGATFSIAFFLSIYLQTVRGMTAWEAGTVMVIQPIVQALFSPLAGRISDKVEPRIPVSIGMLCTSAGLLCLSFLTGNTPLPFLAGILVLLGFGFALFSSPNTNAIMSSVEKRFLGTASALVGAMRVMGQMLSMGVALLLLSLFIGHVQITSEQSAAFQSVMTVGFRIFALLNFAGVFVSYARGNIRSKPVG
ncbi:MAG: MFS transporter [Spirochaetia bacterium]